MINYSDAIMSILVIKHIGRHNLNRIFRGTKIVFSCNFPNISYAKFLITLLLPM